MPGRKLLVTIHRYVGLIIALFMVVAGLTGSAIAFRDELDAWLNPELFEAHSTGALLPVGEIVARVEQSDPRIMVSLLPLHPEPGATYAIGVLPRVDPSTGRPFVLNYNQVFVDPASGDFLGQRKTGACCFERKHLMPFLYIVHNNLMLPGRYGNWLMGGIALLWAIDCFVAISLTFPRNRPFFERWRQAFLIRRGTKSQRMALDMHRSGGLWLWCLLLMLAVTGVSLNLADELVRPVLAKVSTVTPSPREQGRSRFTFKPPAPTFDFTQAAAKAEAAMAARSAAVKAFEVAYLAYYKVYIVSLAEPGRDPETGLGHPHIYLDSVSGEAIRADIPGEGGAGDVFLQWQLPLHSGRVIGLPGQILVAASGIVVAVLAVLGVVIWWHKRRARAQRSRWGSEGAAALQKP
ncbi:PepSY domain-containing protein [Pseudolabrys sp. FHR47]|uniref:PepSY-associated TM helix domain-containing protein n=1 Tax=Pseudolabrys sp. FHR47 TaxID=2562284 RepID=UPI0010BECB69|nr:PepSY-associated TM helix domain-containing protein [Pseudolabrys sp. FHR47]